MAVGIRKGSTYYKENVLLNLLSLTHLVFISILGIQVITILSKILNLKLLQILFMVFNLDIVLKSKLKIMSLNFVAEQFKLIEHVCLQMMTEKMSVKMNNRIL